MCVRIPARAAGHHRFAKLSLSAAALLLMASLSAPVLAVTPGSAAPLFALTTLDGKPVTLAAQRGRWVALEWTNPDCPFVQKHYSSGNMQMTQRVAAENKVVWVQINSTNPQHQDYKSTKQMGDWLQAMKSSPDYAVLDENGSVGKAYAAKTTPQMFLINPAGQVVYNGAIDDKRSTKVEDIPGARNHLTAALGEALSGKAVSVPATVPYGCSVKY